jgi:hypothetical protein
MGIRKAGWVAVLSLFSLLLIFEIYSDYHWAPAQIANATVSGWQVAAKLDNFIDLRRPWTIVKQPITVLWFVKPSDIVFFITLEQFDGALCARASTSDELTKPNGTTCGVKAHIVIAKIVTVTKYRDPTLGYDYAVLEAFDCSTKRSALVTQNVVHSGKVDWDKLGWHTFGLKTPDAQTIDSVCRRTEYKRSVLEQLQKECPNGC